jgi:DNA-binding transcriptional ArsR family regulator
VSPAPPAGRPRPTTSGQPGPRHPDPGQKAEDAAGQAGAVGTPERPLKVTDPRAMRALAHPARIAIMQHLGIEGPATATECAEVAGLSPSACSYHLRALAGYGFVQEDLSSAADGRHRPWRARVVAFSFGDEPGEPAAVRAAGQMLKQSIEAHIDEIREQYRDRQDEYAAEWGAACGLTQDVVHVTPEELPALRGELRDLLGRYRRLDPSERPRGARRVLALQEFVPWFDPGATQ